MRAKYVWADLIRNPRRTLSTVVGVVLGVGLLCAVLFLIDGLSVSMTQRAIAPLPIDMQRVLTAPIGADLRLDQNISAAGSMPPGTVVRVRLVLQNSGTVAANEVVVRSQPPAGFSFISGSVTVDGDSIDTGNTNPFASGAAQAGMNIGVVDPGKTHVFEYEVTAGAPTVEQFRSTVSSREAVTPLVANAADRLNLAQLTTDIAALEGVAFAEQLSFVDLPPYSLSAAGRPDPGALRVFGFDAGYTSHDDTITIVRGSQVAGSALLSASAASALGVDLGDSVSFNLPDGSSSVVSIGGIVDLTRARSLFASRQGADFETFLYVPNAVIIDSAAFANIVVPAYERAAAKRGERVKNPPVREVDIGVARNLLDSDPGRALHQTEQIRARVMAVAGQQDFLLDNISNTLTVASADAGVAKRLFVFLGVPAAVLAALLAAYAGLVLAGAQRRDQATLRIRGASRRMLLSMLAMRVIVIASVGSFIGVALGYISAAVVLGHRVLMQASIQSLVSSAAIGMVAGTLATGTALYVTGRRSIDREFRERRRRIPAANRPIWHVWHLAVLAALIVLSITISKSAFSGTPGSVYVGRSVQLPLLVLLVPFVLWVIGSLLAARLFTSLLSMRRTPSTINVNRSLSFLYLSSIRRRSRSVVEAGVVICLIVALSIGLAIFTHSYDAAKAADARFVVGSDIRISPAAVHESFDPQQFMRTGISKVAPVVYGFHNVIVRSDRTSDPANLAAVDPTAYQQVAPLGDEDRQTIDLLMTRPDALLLNAEFADFLQAEAGDTLTVLLARGTNDQVETELVLVGTYERLPGFPDGAEALMNIAQHIAILPSTSADFFLAQTTDGSNATLTKAVADLQQSSGHGSGLHIDSRATALASDQSSLAALNLRGLVDLDSGYALAMGIAAIAVFVFGLLLQRRREYVTLRAMGISPRSIRVLIGAEAVTAGAAGCIAGVVIGSIMGRYLIVVLRPLFVLTPTYQIPIGATAVVVCSVLIATMIASTAASSLINRLQPAELLREQ